jgi:hypothetical protein
MSVGNVVLRRLFPGCQLRSLATHFDAQPRAPDCDADWSVVRESDSVAFKSFVHETLVAVPAQQQQQVVTVGRAPICSQADVVLRVLGLLYRRGQVVERNGVPGNCLAAGYRPTRESSSAGLHGLEQLEMYTFTPSTHLVKKPLWRELLSRVGDEPMTDLLLNCFVFSPLPNRCYLQLTGAPLRPTSIASDSRVLPPFQAHRSMVVKRLFSEGAPVDEARKKPRNADGARRPRLSAWRRRKARKVRAAQIPPFAVPPSSSSSSSPPPPVPPPPVPAPPPPPPPPVPAQPVPAAQASYWQVHLRAELSECVARTQIFYNSNNILQEGSCRFHPKHVLSLLTTPLPESEEEWRWRARVLAHHIFCDATKSVAALVAADKVALPRHLRGVVEPLMQLLQKYVKCNVPLLLRVHCPIKLADEQAPAAAPAEAAEAAEVFEAVATTPAARPHLKRRRHQRSSATASTGAPSSTGAPTPKRRRREALAALAESGQSLGDDIDLDTYAYLMLDDDVDDDVDDESEAAAETQTLSPMLRHASWPALDAQRELRRRHEQTARERHDLYEALNTANTATLLASHSSFHDVARFVHACLDRLLPLQLLGDARNRRVLYSQLEAFVRMRRFEKLSTRELVSGVSTEAFRFLGGGDDAQALWRRQFVVARLYRWLVNHVIVPLIGGNFYVTESHEHRNQTFYYRRPIWARVVAHWREAQLGRGGDGDSNNASERKAAFEPVPFESVVRVMKRRHFAYSFARLLPKRGGRVRTIMNLGRRPSLYEQTMCEMRPGFAASINSTLAAAHRVLQHETQATPDVLGATVFKWDDIYRRMLGFVRQWRAAGAPPVFACSIDVKNSFDSIEQGPLLDVVLGLVRQEQYYVQRWQSLGPNPHSGHVSLRFHRGVPPAHVAAHDVLGSAAMRAQSLRHAIIADLPPPRVLTRHELHEQLREHVLNNLIKDGGRFYRQRTGIPQGSVLSSLMCCAVYAYVERHCLAPLGLVAPSPLPPSGVGAPYVGVLLRLIDDFLYITTTRPAAIGFTSALMRGFAEYGCTANAQKLQLNFGDVPGAPTEPRRVLPWCGFLLDTATLELRCDYTRFLDAFMNESLTVELAQHAGWSLERKVKHVLKMRLHPLLVDEQLVARETACANVFEAAMLAALKFHAHARALPRHNAAFEVGVIVGVAEYGATLMRDMRSAGGVGHELGMRSSVRSSEVEYVVLRAFELLLRRKPARYGRVLGAVEQRVRSGELRRAARTMRGVVSSSSNSSSAAFEMLKRAL